MTTSQLLILLGFIVVIALAMAAFQLVATGLLERRREPLHAHSVVVHTRDDRSLEGVLVGSHGGRLVLEDAAYIDGPTKTPVGGRAHVPLENVSFVQEL